MLSIRNLWKYYPGSTNPALAGLNLDCENGEFISLVGASGCGKTTALRIVGGLLEATDGSVTIDGVISTGPSVGKAMVFQSFNLFPWRTAEDNAAFGLEAQGVRKAERLARAREYLDIVGMSRFYHSYPSQLSGGQSQRVGIARALATEPDLLLMDEPFGALDALTREQLQIMLKDICKDRSVLFVTHSIDEAIFLSDRIVLMRAPGEVVSTYDVGFDRSLDAGDWRSSSAYATLQAQLRADLSKYHSNSSD